MMLSEWLIMYMWSVVASGPAMRSTEQGNDEFVTLNGVSHTISNSGRMYGTLRSVSAPASRNVMIRFPLSIRSPKVGHWQDASDRDGAMGRETYVALLHGHGRGRVQQVSDAGVLERGVPEVWKGCAVGIGEDERQDFIRVSTYPGVDSCEVGLDGAAIKKSL